VKHDSRFSGDDISDRVEAAAKVAADHARAVDAEGRFPWEAVAALREARLLGIMAPPDLGGEGAGLELIAEICTALAAACASTGMIYAMHQISMGNLLDGAGESPWHTVFASVAVRDQLLFASATTEAGVGGDLRHSICAVEVRGDTLSLTKDASVISYGEQADVLFVTARRDPDAPSSDQVLVVLRKEQCILEPIAVWDAMGMRGTCSGGWRIRAEAPAAQILPKQFADIAADSMVAASHLLWSSVWLGVASDAFARARAYVAAEARKKPGAPHPAATRLADAFDQLQSLECCIGESLRRYAALRAQPDFSPTVAFSLSINALKVNVSTAALQVVDQAMMICGLQGYRNEGPFSIARNLRDIHSARLMISNDRILAGNGQMLLLQAR
jgi:acyl-CoA dehydrogenase